MRDSNPVVPEARSTDHLTRAAGSGASSPVTPNVAASSVVHRGGLLPIIDFPAAGSDAAACSQASSTELETSGAAAPPPEEISNKKVDGERSDKTLTAEEAAAVALEVARAAAERAKATKSVLLIFVILKVLVSYDSGAFSAVLGADNGLTDDLELTTSQQGALGSTVFLGNTVGCAIAGHLFSHYSAKPLMTGSLAAHTLLTFLFGISNLYEVDLVIRFLLGVTLAFIVVYSPIWVDEFAPKSSATLWMALCNAGVPVGIMIGFVIGGMLPTNTTLSWRWAFYLKALLMVPLTMYFNSVDRKLIDCRGGHLKHGEMSINLGWASLQKLFKVLKVLLGNGLLMSSIFSLCSLYFVVTALQTFVTPYLRGAPFNASMNTIVLGFGGATVTAPVLGVIAGGVLLDRIGGYHRNLRRASLFQVAWGLVAGVVSFACMSTTTTASFLVVMWVLLFCGGAIVPAATGIIMASIDEKRRAAASSFSAICFNLFGYFSGPLICGIVADSHGLVWGIRTAFIVSFVGIIPMGLACYFARTHVTSGVQQHAASAHDDGAGAVSVGTTAMTTPLPGDSGDSENGTERLGGPAPHATVDSAGVIELVSYDDPRDPAANTSVIIEMIDGQPQRHPRGMVIAAQPDRLAVSSVASRSPSSAIECSVELDLDRVSNASIHMYPNPYAGALDLIAHYHEVNHEMELAAAESLRERSSSRPPSVAARGPSSAAAAAAAMGQSIPDTPRGGAATVSFTTSARTSRRGSQDLHNTPLRRDDRTLGPEDFPEAS